VETKPEFVVKVESESLKRSPKGTIAGIICCQRGEHSFPQRQWYDLPMAVLSWWLQTTVSLVDGTERTVEVRFMDGPYYVRVFARNRERWQAELVEDRAPRPTVQQFEFDPDPYIRSLIACSDALLKRCSREGWTSRDIDSIILHRQRLIHYAADKRDLRLP